MPRMTEPTKKRLLKRNKTMFDVYEAGIPLAEIGRMFGITREAVRRIIRNLESEKRLS